MKLLLLLSFCLLPFFSIGQINGGGKNFQPRVVMTNSLATGGIGRPTFSTNNFTSTTTTLDTPLGHGSGGLLVFFSCTDSSAQLTALPAGFTQVESNSLAQAGFVAAYKFTDGGEDETLTFTFGSTEAGASALLYYPNVNATPFDGDNVNTAAPGAGVEHTTAAILPNQNNSVIIGVIYIDPTAVPTFTAVSGYELICTSTRSTSGAMGIADRIQTTATSEGVQIIESDGGTWAGYSFVIRPP